MKKIFLLVLFITYSFNISFANCACIDAFEQTTDNAQDECDQAKAACDAQFVACMENAHGDHYLNVMCLNDKTDCDESADSKQGQQYGEAVQDFNCCAPDFTGC